MPMRTCTPRDRTPSLAPSARYRATRKPLSARRRQEVPRTAFGRYGAPATGAPRGRRPAAGREPRRGGVLQVSSAPLDGGWPAAERVTDPALTGLRGTGIVVSRAQGALGLLP